MAAEPAHHTARMSHPAAGGPGREPTATPGQPAVRLAKQAVERVINSETMLIELPEGLGMVRLPSPKRLAFYGGIVALAAFGILDWPVALVIGAGHLLADDHHHKALAELGEALAEA
jgi:hypothetical protein